MGLHPLRTPYPGSFFSRGPAHHDILEYVLSFSHNALVTLMAVLGALVAAGLLAVWRWSDLEMRVPWRDHATTPGPLPVWEVVRRYIWYLTIVAIAGVVPGLVMIGAGGRLAMRLLAVTAGDVAQGRITEADQIVGNITVDGTMGFVIFFGVFGGLLTGALYVLIERWLPEGRWGGLTYGALLLVLGGTRLEPLRPENPDFDIVGPGWVSVIVFVALGLAHGMLVAAIASRYSRLLPPISKRPGAIAAHAPLVIYGMAFPVLVPIVGVGVLATVLSRSAKIRRLIASARIEKAGRVLGVALAAIALPGFAAALIDIAGRA